MVLFSGLPSRRQQRLRERAPKSPEEARMMALRQEAQRKAQAERGIEALKAARAAAAAKAAAEKAAAAAPPAKPTSKWLKVAAAAAAILLL